MGFLDDLRKGAQKAKKALDESQKATGQQAADSGGVEVTAEAISTTFDRQGEFDWATPEEYDPIPPVKLQAWGVFDGSEAGHGGYGLEWPDGRLLYPKRLGIRRWKSVGMYYGGLSGGKYHLEDLSDPGFGPGQPLQLVAEPDNPHSEKGTAISVRNWAGDKAAGYVPTEMTSDVRKITDGQEFGVIVLRNNFDIDPNGSARIVRTYLDWVIFRPGRIEVLDLPSNPPIAPPREETE